MWNTHHPSCENFSRLHIGYCRGAFCSKGSCQTWEGRQWIFDHWEWGMKAREVIRENREVLLEDLSPCDAPLKQKSSLIQWWQCILSPLSLFVFRSFFFPAAFLLPTANEDAGNPPPVLSSVNYRVRVCVCMYVSGRDCAHTFATSWRWCVSQSWIRQERGSCLSSESRGKKRGYEGTKWVILSLIAPLILLSYSQSLLNPTEWASGIRIEKQGDQTIIQVLLFLRDDQKGTIEPMMRSGWVEEQNQGGIEEADSGTSAVITPHFPSLYSGTPSFFFFAKRSSDPWMTNHPASRMLSESIESEWCVFVVYVCTGSLIRLLVSGKTSCRQNQLANSCIWCLCLQATFCRLDLIAISFNSTFRDGRTMWLVATIWIPWKRISLW